MSPLMRAMEEVINRHLAQPGSTFKVTWAGETTRPGGGCEYGVTGHWQKPAEDIRGEPQVEPRTKGKWQGFSESVHAAAVMAQQPEQDHAMTLPAGMERLPGVNL